jgi:hypothetical protein
LGSGELLEREKETRETKEREGNHVVENTLLIF